MARQFRIAQNERYNTMAKQTKTDVILDIHGITLALRKNDTNGVVLQRSINALIGNTIRDLVIPALDELEKEDKDDVFALKFVTGDLVALAQDIKDTGVNPEQRKRMHDDMNKRIMRGCDTFAKHCEAEHMANPLEDTAGNLRRLTVSSGTKKAPAPVVKFKKAKQPQTLEQITKNFIALAHKLEYGDKAIEAEVIKQIAEANSKPEPVTK